MNVFSNPLAAPGHRDAASGGLREMLMARAEMSEPEDGLTDVATSGGFIALLTAFRASGGTARAGDLNRLLEDRAAAEAKTGLDSLLALRQVFGFEWRDTFWIPMFQFDLADLSVRRGPQQVAAELHPFFDSWRLVAWFARPHGWLGGKRPVDLLDASLSEVLDAARVDRFVAAG